LDFHISQAFTRRALLGGSVSVFAGCRRRPELPRLGHVPAFGFSNQDQKRVDASSLRGSVWVAAFMFTRCPTICPRITRRMRALQDRAAANKVALRLVSISVDPENDSPQVLREYARKYGADTSNWSFLTGDFASIQKVAVDGFKLALEGRPDAGASDLGILHGSHLVLVDRELEIRGYYQTDDDAAMTALLADATQLSG
jgi:protein SCO1/2